MSNLKIRLWKEGEPVPWQLLLDADSSRVEVRKYLNRGELWVAEKDKKVIGAMVLLQTRIDVVEIVNIATMQKHRSQGVGTALLRKAKARAKNLKAHMLQVGTGNNSFPQLIFYQRFGFRIVGVERDFFVKRYKKKYERSGVVLRDMVRLEMPV